MFIDHVGYAFLSDEPIFRIIGRLSFPIFAWLLAQGEQHTRDVLRYLARLLVMAVISQPFYSALFEVSQLNVLFTLAIGLAAVRLGRQSTLQRYVVWILGIAVALIVPIDAGAYGICVILMMSMWRSPMLRSYTLRWWGMWLVLHIIFIGLINYSSAVQFWALSAPILLHLTSSQRGARARWFYGFYPGHLAALLALKLLLN